MWLQNLLKQISLFFSPKKSGEHATGLLESPADYRDIPLSAVQKLIALPDDYEIPYNLPVSYQNGYPHCVGHAGALLKGEKERREQNYIDFDPVWLYNECKKIDGMPDVEGTYFRAVLKVLKNKGAKPLNQPESEAEKYRIGGYAQVQPLSFVDLKNSIYQNGIVLAGFKGSNEGWASSLKGYIKPPKSGERQWGHATGAIGFNKDYIKGQNSWGESWGDKGKFYYGQDYLPFEAWAVLIDLPNNWKDLIGNADRPVYFFTKDLSFGMVDKDVKILQECLKFEGCFPKEVGTVNTFGPLTLESAKKFQTKYNIQPVSGFVGRLTRNKLNEIYCQQN